MLFHTANSFCDSQIVAFEDSGKLLIVTTTIIIYFCPAKSICFACFCLASRRPSPLENCFMKSYPNQTRYLAAVDCIVFGYDGQHLKLLLIKRGMEPEKNKWSLMGGFVQPAESADAAAARILKILTGLEGIYLEQLATFSDPLRDPIERTVSIVYFSLIDISQYEKQLSDNYQT
jgi:ADP-ribose pyrophosphatase YjhB (NUDIX family)